MNPVISRADHLFFEQEYTDVMIPLIGEEKVRCGILVLQAAHRKNQKLQEGVCELLKLRLYQFNEHHSILRSADLARVAKARKIMEKYCMRLSKMKLKEIKKVTV